MDKSHTVILLPKLQKSLEEIQLTKIGEEGQYMDLLHKGSDFSKQNAKNIRFGGSQFIHVDFGEGKLEKLYISDCVIEDSNLANAFWNEGVLKVVQFKNCRLTGMQLNETSLTDLTFSDCKIDYGQFQFMKCKRVKFERCNLVNSYFQGSDLSGVIFEDCELKEADFSQAKLKGADFRGSNVSGMRVGLEELRGAIFDNSQIYYLVQLLGVRIE